MPFLLNEEERQKALSSSSNSLVPAAFKSDSSHGGRGKSRGHGRSTDSGGRGGRSTNASRKCDHCGKDGHTINFCWDLHGKSSGTRRVSYGATAVEISPGVSQSGSRYVQLSEEQFQRLLRERDQVLTSTSAADVACSAALQASSSSPWIVDTGATDHMTGPHDGEEDWWWS